MRAVRGPIYAGRIAYLLLSVPQNRDRSIGELESRYARASPRHVGVLKLKRRKYGTSSVQQRNWYIRRSAMGAGLHSGHPAHARRKDRRGSFQNTRRIDSHGVPGTATLRIGVARAKWGQMEAPFIGAPTHSKAARVGPGMSVSPKHTTWPSKLSTHSRISAHPPQRHESRKLSCHSKRRAGCGATNLR
jgi:hypothetical protein